jgi:steroid delta-isomerase-like uncharacterized protein
MIAAKFSFAALAAASLLVTPAAFAADAGADRATIEKGIKRMFAEGFGKGNAAVVDELCAANFIEHEVMMPGQKPGREGLKQMIKSMHTAFPDLKMEVLDLAMDGDKVFLRYAMSGTQKGAFMGKPATGKKFKIQGFDQLRFAKGKAAEHWGQGDDVGMMTQLGMMKP